MYSHTQMVMVDDHEGLEREGTAELKNDPRFFTENVIDKRLAAFEAVAIVTELISVEAVKQCFDLANEFEYVGDMVFAGAIQMIGFLLMVSVMFMSTVATAVLSLQLFFTIRLMTASPTGFDKAARFYQDHGMWQWRERAIFAVKWCLVTFMLSTGCMLYVKFYTKGFEGHEGHEGNEGGHESMVGHALEYKAHKVFAVLILVVFTCLSAIVLWLVKHHQRVFDQCYATLDICHNELNRHLVSHR